MEIVIFWAIASVLVAVYASRRGRSGLLAFIFAVLLSPLLAFILYVALGESRKGRETRIIEEERIRAEARKRLG